MRKTKFTKVVALATVATMLMSSLAAFAAESDDGATNAGNDINGTGSVEDYVDKDKFKVVLPTVTEVDFTIDPQGLLNIADSTTYTTGAGSVFFKNVDSDSNVTYSDTSDAIIIGNKSSYDVDVAFSVEVTLPEGITLVENEGALADATTPSLYLGLIANGAAEEALESGVNTANVATVTGIAEDQENKNGYYIKATSADSGYTYEYVLDEQYTGTPATASYTLTGACDTTADWGDVKELNVTAKITWACAKTGTLNAEEETQVTEIVGASITNSGDTATYSTSIAFVDRLNDGGAVVFRLSSSDLSSIDGLDVSKIEVDGVSYAYTTGTANDTENSDGLTYKL